MTQPHPQPNPNELLSITREELERCCSQMSAAGYKVSANYVEAMVLSRSRPHTPAAPATFPNSTELIQMAETEWHNREERFGLHDKIPWTTGWMSGFLTPNKPGLCDKCNILEVEDRLMELEQGLKDASKAEREQVLLKYQNWVAKEAKMALNGETRALVVRLNSKLIKEIESLRGGA